MEYDLKLLRAYQEGYNDCLRNVSEAIVKHNLMNMTFILPTDTKMIEKEE